MTVGALRSIDSGLSSTIALGTVTATGYCLESVVGNKEASVTGPGGTIVQTDCP
jgi:hypothetical protein